MQTEDVTHVEIEENSIELGIESVINDKLVRSNVTEAVLSALEAKYKGLKIKDIDDREGYNAVKEARKECKGLRVMTTKICRKGREDALAVQKAWIGKEKEVVARIEGVETPLEEQEKWFDAEKERIKAAKKAKEDRQWMVRSMQLTQMGAAVVGDEFILDDVSFELSLIRESEDDTYDESILPKYQVAYERINAERIAAERAKAEQLAAEQKAREEFEKQQAEFKRQQEEFEKQKAEIARREQEKIDAENRILQEAKKKKFYERISQLGYSYNGFTVSYKGNIVGSMDDVLAISDEEYSAKVKKHQEEVELEIKETEDKRLAEIENQKKLAVEKSLREERERIEKEAAAEALRLQQEEARKAEEFAKAKDKEKWEDVLKYLESTPLHEMRSSQYRVKMKIVKDFLNDIKGK